MCVPSDNTTDKTQISANVCHYNLYISQTLRAKQKCKQWNFSNDRLPTEDRLSLGRVRRFACSNFGFLFNHIQHSILVVVGTAFNYLFHPECSGMFENVRRECILFAILIYWRSLRWVVVKVCSITNAHILNNDVRNLLFQRMQTNVFSGMINSMLCP